MFLRNWYNLRAMINPGLAWSERHCFFVILLKEIQCHQLRLIGNSLASVCTQLYLRHAPDTLLLI